MFNFAHAGESHDTVIEATAHTATPWYIAVPLFLIAVLAIGYIVWIVSKKNFSVVLSVLAIVFLISGFTLFNFSSAISVISLTLGFITAGILAFGDLTTSSSKKE